MIIKIYNKIMKIKIKDKHFLILILINNLTMKTKKIMNLLNNKTEVILKFVMMKKMKTIN